MTIDPQMFANAGWASTSDEEAYWRQIAAHGSAWCVYGADGLKRFVDPNEYRDPHKEVLK